MSAMLNTFDIRGKNRQHWCSLETKDYGEEWGKVTLSNRHSEFEALLRYQHLPHNQKWPSCGTTAGPQVHNTVSPLIDALLF